MLKMNRYCAFLIAASTYSMAADDITALQLHFSAERGSADVRTKDASSATADPGAFWLLDAVGAWVSRLGLGDTSVSAEGGSAALLTSADDVATDAMPRVYNATTRSLVSMPKETWVLPEDINTDGSGIINVKLNSQLQMAPGKVAQESTSTTSSLLQYFPLFEAVGSLYRYLQNSAKDSTTPRSLIEPKVKGVRVDPANDTGVIQVTLESELQTGAHEASPSLLQFWPLDAITEWYHNRTARPPPEPLDLPELLASKDFIAQQQAEVPRDTNESGILRVKLSSELQIGVNSADASKRSRGVDSPQYQSGSVGVVPFPRVIFMSLCLLFGGVMQLVNYCTQYCGESWVFETESNKPISEQRREAQYGTCNAPPSVAKCNTYHRRDPGPGAGPPVPPLPFNGPGCGLQLTPRTPRTPRPASNISPEASDRVDSDVEAIRGGF